MLSVELRYPRSTQTLCQCVPEVFRFPGGEIQVRLAIDPEGLSAIRIHALLRSADDVMALLLLTNALRQQAGGQTPIDLDMPYIPYARQDRVCNPGEALSIKVFCSLINAQDYRTVTVTDPHSDVALALLDRVRVRDVSVFVQQVLEDPAFKNGVTLLAPDAGALRRVQDLARRLGIDQVVSARKQRDPRTGRITGLELIVPLPPTHPVLVVDDICDGGRTFLELAAAMPFIPEGGRFLYITHAIFSQGPAALLAAYDKVFTPYDWTHSRVPGLVSLTQGA